MLATKKLAAVPRALAVRRLVLVGLAAGALTLMPLSAAALELGLTPSNVYSIWSNINDAVVAVAHVSTGDEKRVAKLKDLKARAFKNKTPGDVLHQVGEFREHLDDLRRRGGMGATNKFIERQDAATTPSDVFLNSGYALNGLVEWLILNTDRKQLVSPFYTRHRFTEKTPNDVFALVDLATRRLARVSQWAAK